MEENQVKEVKVESKKYNIPYYAELAVAGVMLVSIFLSMFSVSVSSSGYFQSLYSESYGLSAFDIFRSPVTILSFVGVIICVAPVIILVSKYLSISSGSIKKLDKILSTVCASVALFIVFIILILLNSGLSSLMSYASSFSDISIGTGIGFWLYVLSGIATIVLPFLPRVNACSLDSNGQVNLDELKRAFSETNKKVLSFSNELLVTDCPSCTEKVSKNATFCTSCGLEMPKTKVPCNKCEILVNVNDAFCPKCGDKMESTESSNVEVSVEAQETKIEE